MFAKQRWRYSKGSCPRPERGRRRPTHSVSWLRHLLLTMILISLLPAANSRNFESFGAFWKFFGNLQVFACGVVSPPPRDHSWGLLRMTKSWHFWKGHAKTKPAYTWEKLDFEILASKSSKYIKNLTFCPLFELQKVTLGELTFEGSNQLQIQKFHLGWRVDRPSFPMSHLALDLDHWDPLKRCCKGARPLEQGARPLELNLPVLTFQAWKLCFHLGCDFYL